MMISKEVIRDLIPVYLSGDASADTKALVEESLSSDPELRATVERARSFELPRTQAPPTLEKSSLDQTRKLLARKNMSFGLALFLTFLPYSFAFQESRVVFLFYRDMPYPALAVLALAYIYWFVFLKVSTRLRAAGIEPPRTTAHRLLWALVGYAAVLPMGLTLARLTGWPLWHLGLLGAIVAEWIGLKIGRIATVDEINRPQGLFGK